VGTHTYDMHTQTHTHTYDTQYMHIIHTLTHTHSLTHSLSLSLSHTHTRTHTHRSRHPNVTAFHGAAYDGHSIVIAFEYMHYRSMKDVLKKLGIYAIFEISANI